jgi:hypothetical protein
MRISLQFQNDDKTLVFSIGEQIDYFIKEFGKGLFDGRIFPFFMISWIPTKIKEGSEEKNTNNEQEVQHEMSVFNNLNFEMQSFDNLEHLLFIVVEKAQAKIYQNVLSEKKVLNKIFLVSVPGTNIDVRVKVCIVFFVNVISILSLVGYCKNVS